MSFSERVSNPRGFTLIEILMVIILIGILALVSTGSLNSSLNESRFQETSAKLRQIKNAMIGDPDIKELSTRTSFGFLGDIGGFPSASNANGISQLVSNPVGALAAYTAHAVDSTTRISAGWNGPYLATGVSGDDHTKDSWGNVIQYNGSVDPVQILSYGADGAAGGTGLNQDITVSIAKANVLVTVKGFVCQNGGPYTSATQVELNYPNGSGGITQTLATPDANGLFTFSNVPIGVRSITLYEPNKAAATKTVGPNLITIDRPNYMVPCAFVDIGP